MCDLLLLEAKMFVEPSTLSAKTCIMSKNIHQNLCKTYMKQNFYGKFIDKP
jgi:hypothetical protein